MAMKKTPSSGQAPETFKDLLQILEKNNGRTNSVERWLPKTLIAHLGNKDSTLLQRYDMIDKDKRGYLSSSQLPSITVQLAKLDKDQPEQIAKVKGWIAIFDKDGVGKVARDDFPDFVKYILVISYLSNFPADSPLTGKAGQAPPAQKSSTTRAEPPGMTANTIQKAKTLKEQGAESTVREVITLLEKFRGRLANVIQFLPDNIVTYIKSDKFKDEGLTSRYDEMDKSKRGHITAAEILPIVFQVTRMEKVPANMEKAKKWTMTFDKSGAGKVTRDEFAEFVRFVLVINYLSNQPQDAPLKSKSAQKGTAQKAEAKPYRELLQLLERDKGRTENINPYMPDTLKNHLNSDVFSHDNMVKRFDMLDKTNKGYMAPASLHPIVLQITKLDAGALSQDKCRSMVSNFDKTGRGGVTRQDFPDFVRYLLVFAWLKTQHPDDKAQPHTSGIVTIEKQPTLKKSQTEKAPPPSPSEKTMNRSKSDDSGRMGGRRTMIGGPDHMDRLSALKQYEAFIKQLRADPEALDEICECLPLTLVEEIQSEAFNKKCIGGFKKLDTEGKGTLHPVKLVPGMIKLCEGHPTEVNREACKKYTTMFVEDVNAGIARTQMTSLCKFVMVMGYLQFIKTWRDTEKDPERRDKVQRLLTFVKEHKDRVWEVLPMLPEDLQDGLISGDFTKDCSKWFGKFDKDKHGILSTAILVPCVIAMCQVYPFTFSKEQCKQFADIYDKDDTEEISQGEFAEFVRFILVMSYLTAEEAKTEKLSHTINEGADKVENWLSVLERDRNAVQKIVPLLPDRVFTHLTSQDFVDVAEERFRTLDRDESGTLSPEELHAVIVEFSESHTRSVSTSQCERFTKIFDVDADGVIDMDEFLNFTRFMCIISYLNSDEGKKEFSEGRKILRDSKNFEEIIKLLDDHGPQGVEKVIQTMPEDMRKEVYLPGFDEECARKFKELDNKGTGSLGPQQLMSVIIDITDAHRHAIDVGQCQRMAAKFDNQGTGSLSQDSFIKFTQFLMVVSYLQQSARGQAFLEKSFGKDNDGAAKPKQGEDNNESNEGHKKVETFLTMLESDREAIKKIVPILPKSVFQHLTSDEFVKDSTGKFKTLNKNKLSILSPKELYPIIVELAEANPQSVDLKQCERFTAMFANEGEGGLTVDDFLNFARFMHIMMYVLSEEGHRDFPEGGKILAEHRQAAEDKAAAIKAARGSSQTGDKKAARSLEPVKPPEPPPSKEKLEEGKKRVEQFLSVLERDRNLIPKIVKFIPKKVFDHMTGEAFMTAATSKFQNLDQNKDGELTPQLLYPVIVELSEAPSQSVDLMQCQRFTKIFDVEEHGYLDIDSFLNFMRFMHISMYVNSEEGKKEFPDGHQILLDSKKIEDLIGMLEKAPHEMSKVLPHLPDELRSQIMGEPFSNECKQAFAKLPKDAEGCLRADQLKPIILGITNAHKEAVDVGQCKRFLHIFDDDGAGHLTEDAFVNFKRFLVVMSFLQTEDGRQLLQEIMEEAAAEGYESRETRAAPLPVAEPMDAEAIAGHKQVEQILTVLETDRATVQKIVPLLPKTMFEKLTDKKFIDDTNGRFRGLDDDGSGTLTAQELYPVICEISGAPAQAVDMKQCERFVNIFDLHGDGVVRIDEFLNFTRFMHITMYIHSETGKKEFPDGRKILADSKHIEELITMLEAAPTEMQQVLPHLPDELKAQIMGEEYTTACKEAFQELDEENDGCLGPLQLKKVIMQLTNAHTAAVDLEQCQRFLAIFDDVGDETMTEEEFINFKRFLSIMSYVQSEAGSKALKKALGVDSAILNANKKLPPSASCVNDAEGVRRVEAFLSMLENDKSAVQKIVPLLPKKVFEHMTADDFVEKAQSKFTKLDDDQDEVLTPQELFPLVVEVSKALPQCVDFGQCERFINCFDVHGDGVLRFEEFSNFERFMYLSQYLQSEEGQKEFPEGNKIVKDSRKVEDLINQLEDAQIEYCMAKIVECLPENFTEEVMGEKFEKTTTKEFKRFDKEGHGNLNPIELKPIIQGLLDVHPGSIDLSQCKRFVELFDDDDEGVMSKQQFVNFKRFYSIVQFLLTDEGKECLQRAEEMEDDHPAREESKVQKKKGGKSQQELEQEGAQRVEEFLNTLEADQSAMQKIIPLIPKKVFKGLTSEQFLEMAEQKFKGLDENEDDSLSPQELFPFICELSQAPPQVINLTHCARFVKIFDMGDTGLLRLEEFLSFFRFMQISMFLSSPAGTKEFPEGRKIMEDSKRTEQMIKMCEETPDEEMDILIAKMPEQFRSMLTSDQFVADSEKAYTKMDPSGSGKVPPQKLKNTLLSLTGASPHAIDAAQCKRLACCIAKDEAGVLDKELYMKLRRNIMVTSFFQSPDGKKILGVDNKVAKKTVTINADAEKMDRPRKGSVHHLHHTGESKKEAAERVEEFLELLEHDKNSIQKIVPMLPRHVFEYLTSDEFVEETTEQFEEYDDDVDGLLSPQELFPLLVEVSEAPAQCIDFNQCERFVDIFDMHDDGALRQDEFLNFKRFMFISTWVSSDEGKEEFPDGSKILHDSKRIEDMIDVFEGAPHQVQEILPSLPNELKKEIMGEDFVAHCRETFDALDEDGDECLAAEQLKPLILGITDAHPAAVDNEQCRRFAEIFDDKENGVVDFEEFVNFKRFLIIFSQTAQGSQLLGIERMSDRKRSSMATVRDEDQQKFDRVLEMMEFDKGTVENIAPMLPAKLTDEMSSEEFKDACRTKFGELDEDNDGKLVPQETMACIIEDCQLPEEAVDLKGCERFVAIFDANTDSALDESEFAEFKRYMRISKYLHSEEGAQYLPAGQKILTDSKQVQDLIMMMKKAPKELQELLPNLPPKVKAEITNQQFSSDAAEAFKALDEGGSGSLPPEKLKTTIIEVVQVHPDSVNATHCKRLLEIFDIEEKGSLSVEEYTKAKIFLKIFGSMQNEGKKKADPSKSRARSRGVSDATKVDNFLADVEAEFKNLEKVETMIPAKVLKPFDSDEFKNAIKVKFDGLDEDSDGMLKPQELVPIVLDLDALPADLVDIKVCARFLKIFDTEGHGMMEYSDFLTFIRFQSIKMYLGSEAGKRDCPDGLKVLTEKRHAAHILATEAASAVLTAASSAAAAVSASGLASGLSSGIKGVFRSGTTNVDAAKASASELVASLSPSEEEKVTTANAGQRAEAKVEEESDESKLKRMSTITKELSKSAASCANLNPDAAAALAQAAVQVAQTIPGKAGSDAKAKAAAAMSLTKAQTSQKEKPAEQPEKPKAEENVASQAAKPPKEDVEPADEPRAAVAPTEDSPAAEAEPTEEFIPVVFPETELPQAAEAPEEEDKPAEEPQAAEAPAEDKPAADAGSSEESKLAAESQAPEAQKDEPPADAESKEGRSSSKRKPKPNDTELANIKETFKKVDVNGDGAVDLEEFMAAFKEQWADWSNEDFKELFDAADVDKDGVLNLEEFADWLWEKEPGPASSGAAVTAASEEPSNPEPEEKSILSSFW